MRMWFVLIGGLLTSVVYAGTISDDLISELSTVKAVNGGSLQKAQDGYLVKNVIDITKVPLGKGVPVHAVAMVRSSFAILLLGNEPEQKYRKVLGAYLKDMKASLDRNPTYIDNVSPEVELLRICLALRIGDLQGWEEPYKEYVTHYFTQVFEGWKKAQLDNFPHWADILNILAALSRNSRISMSGPLFEVFFKFLNDEEIIDLYIDVDSLESSKNFIAYGWLEILWGLSGGEHFSGLKDSEKAQLTELSKKLMIRSEKYQHDLVRYFSVVALLFNNYVGGIEFGEPLIVNLHRHLRSSRLSVLVNLITNSCLRKGMEEDTKVFCTNQFAKEMKESLNHPLGPNEHLKEEVELLLKKIEQI